ncbi:jg15802, partial [Pararge aegeria aegeria]
NTRTLTREDSGSAASSPDREPPYRGERDDGEGTDSCYFPRTSHLLSPLSRSSLDLRLSLKLTTF